MNRRCHENCVSKLNHLEGHSVFERRKIYGNFLIVEMSGKSFNLPGYYEFRLESCILIVEFLQILSFCKETFYLFEKNLCMQNLYFIMRKDFMYFFVLRMSAMCVFGRYRRLSGEFASFDIPLHILCWPLSF